MAQPTPPKGVVGTKVKVKVTFVRHEKECVAAYLAANTLLLKPRVL